MPVPMTRTMTRAVRAVIIGNGGPALPENRFRYFVQSDKKFADVAVQCVSREQAQELVKRLEPIFKRVEIWEPHRHRTHHEVHVHVIRLD